MENEWLKKKDIFKGNYFKLFVPEGCLLDLLIVFYQTKAVDRLGKWNWTKTLVDLVWYSVLFTHAIGSRMLSTVWYGSFLQIPLMKPKELERKGY